jgi:hypothetical protein
MVRNSLVHAGSARKRLNLPCRRALDRAPRATTRFLIFLFTNTTPITTIIPTPFGWPQDLCAADTRDAKTSDHSAADPA